MIVALVCAAMLIAVPLYLWRKPSTKTGGALSAVSASASAGAQAAPKLAQSSVAVPATPAGLTLGEIQKVRCGSSPGGGRGEGTLCDSLAPFEGALKKAVSASQACAPKPKVKGSINFVLTIDFVRKKLHVFPGASGDWRGKQARRATNCVKKAIEIADWDIPHQFRYYSIAILATYAAPVNDAVTAPVGTPPTLPTGPNLPTFE